MKRISTLAMILAAAAFTGCQKGEPTGGQDNGAETQMTINLGQLSGRGLDGTEMDGDADENKIFLLEFYVFDQNGNPDVKVGQSASGKNDGYGYYRHETTESTVTFNLSSGDGKKFVAAVNMDLGKLETGQKYTDLKLRMAKRSFTRSNARGKNTANGFEMQGEATTDVKEALANKLRMNVNRITSKLITPTFNSLVVSLTEDQIKDVWGDATTVVNSDITFDFKGYVLINGLTNSDAFFISATDEFAIPWASWRTGYDGVTKEYLNSTFTSAGYYQSNYSGYGNTDFFLAYNTTEPIYFYENAPELITFQGATGWDPKTVYSVMLKADLKVPAVKGETKTRYWRINLTHEEDYHILRNCVYKVNVKKIATPGFETPKEAEEDPKIIPGKGESSIEVEIVPVKWRVNFYNTEV